MLSSLCYVDNKREPIDKDTFRVCMECGHVFQTAQEIIDGDVTIRKQINEDGGIKSFPEDPVPIESIYSCPLCLHDW